MPLGLTPEPVLLAEVLKASALVPIEGDDSDPLCSQRLMKDQETSCRHKGRQRDSLYADGVFITLFTSVSDQIGSVFLVEELHLRLVSLQRACKPEPSMNNYYTYNAINHPEHEDDNIPYCQSHGVTSKRIFSGSGSTYQSWPE